MNTERDSSGPGPGRRNAAILEVQAWHCRACGPETTPGKMNGPWVRQNLANEEKQAALKALVLALRQPCA